MADGDAASAGVRKRRARSRSESAVPDEFWGRLEVVLGSEPPPARGRSHVWKWNEEQQKMRIVPKVPPRKRAPDGKAAAPADTAAAVGGASAGRKNKVDPVLDLFNLNQVGGGEGSGAASGSDNHAGTGPWPGVGAWEKGPRESKREGFVSAAMAGMPDLVANVLAVRGTMAAGCATPDCAGAAEVTCAACSAILAWCTRCDAARHDSVFLLHRRLNMENGAPLPLPPVPTRPAFTCLVSRPLTVKGGIVHGRVLVGHVAQLHPRGDTCGCGSKRMSLGWTEQTDDLIVVGMDGARAHRGLRTVVWAAYC